MLIGEPLSRSSATCLYLVEYQQQIIFICQFPETRQEIVRRNAYAPFALNGFEHDRASLVIDGIANGVDVAEGSVRETRQKRTDSFMIFGLTRGGQGRKRAAVKTPMKSYDLVAVWVPMQSRQLEGGFIGLGA